MSMESDAKEAAILSLLSGFPSYRATDTFIEEALASVEAFSVEAVVRACRRYAHGEVPEHNNAFPPSVPQLVVQVRLFEGVLAYSKRQEAPRLHSGILEVDCGHGKIDMRGLTVDEQDQVLRLGGKSPDGRNLAGMSVQAIVEALRAEPVGEIEAPKTVIPRLKTMREASDGDRS